MKSILSAHVLIFKANKVLLVKHGQGAGHLTGVYGIPGGRLDEKETFENAATREFFEETGLIVKKKDLQKFAKNEFTADIKRKDGNIKRYTMTVFFALNFSGSLKKSSETEPQWIKISELDYYNLLPNVKNAVLAAKNSFTKP